jgi:tRNA dimethylallyltransferase
MELREAKVVAVFGPTGSGKTDVAVHLARALGTEVVNCDPAQCYTGFPILTNQPTPAHDAVAPHRMVACWPLTFESTAAAFAEQVHAAIDDLVAANGVAVACGGSGLYLRSALSDLGFATTGEPDADLRATLERDYEQHGGTAMLARVAELDPAAAAGLHPNNAPRVIRALEAALGGGTVTGEGSGLWDAPYRHATAIVGLQVERHLVHARIDARTDAMFAAGVVEEVAGVLGPRGELRSDRTVISATAAKLHGLQDICGLLAGDHDEPTARDLMARRTRQYAKRQDTWARRWPGLTPVPVAEGASGSDVSGMLLA